MVQKAASILFVELVRSATRYQEITTRSEPRGDSSNEWGRGDSLASLINSGMPDSLFFVNIFPGRSLKQLGDAVTREALYINPRCPLSVFVSFIHRIYIEIR